MNKNNIKKDIINNTIKSDSDTNTKQKTIVDIFNSDNILKYYYKNIKNEHLFNHILNNSLYLSNPLLNYLRYTKLSPYLPENNNSPVDEFSTKSLSIVYKNNNINLMTFLYDSKDSPQYVIYGINLVSMDGEYRPHFTSYISYVSLETELNEHITFLYNSSLKYKLFDTFVVKFNNKQKDISNKHYIRVMLIIIDEMLKQIRGQLDGHINTDFLGYLEDNKELIYDIIIDVININHVHIIKFILLFGHERSTKGKSELPVYTTDRFKPLLKFFYKLVSKTIPNNKILSALREMRLTYEISKLKLNNITSNVPLTYHYYKLLNYDFNNPNINKSISDSKIIGGMDLYNNLYNHYSTDIDDYKCNKNYNFEYFKLCNDLKNVKKNEIISNSNIIIILEFVGKTMGDFPYILQSINEFVKIQNTDISKLTNKRDIIMNLMTNRGRVVEQPKKSLAFKDHLFYIYQHEFDMMLFQFIYTLYALNLRVQIIHNDLHLNNITINGGEFATADYLITNDDITKIIIDNNIDLDNETAQSVLFYKLNNIYKNIYSLSDVNKKNNTFIVNSQTQTISIIDFSRAIVCDEYEIFDLLELIYDIFPFIKKNKKINDVLTEYLLIKPKYKIIFKIMSGYDVYISFKNLYSMFTEETKYNIPIPIKKIVKLINTIKNDSYKIMYKNLMKYLSNKSGKLDFEYTTKILLYKHFDYLLLKHYKKSDFMDLNKSDDRIFPSQELLLSAYYNNKYISRIHYNVNNPIIVNNLNEMIDKMYNKI